MVLQLEWITNNLDTNIRLYSWSWKFTWKIGIIEDSYAYNLALFEKQVIENAVNYLAYPYTFSKGRNFVIFIINIQI